MKLIQLDIQAFGSFKNRQFLFPDGFSIAYGENEQGKSTLMACLKALFYGFPSRSRSLLDNDRLRCQPWDGSRMSASLVFSHAGLRYRLQRSFGKSKAQDETVLMNDISGEKIPLPSQQEIGPFLFQVPVEEFTNTVFIGQMNSLVTDPDHSTLAKLTNLTGSLHEGLSSQAIDTRLQKAQVKLRAERGGGGLIPQMEQQLASLAAEREQAVESEARQQLRSHQLKALQRKKSDFLIEKETVANQLAMMDFASQELRYNRLAARQQAIQESIQSEKSLAAQLAAHAIDETRLSDWRKELSQLQMERYEILSKIRDFGESERAALAEQAAANWRILADSQQRVQELSAQLSNLEQSLTEGQNQPVPKPLPAWFHVISLILFLSGFLAGALVDPIFFFLTVAAALIWTFAFLKYKRDFKVSYRKTKDAARFQSEESVRRAAVLKRELAESQTIAAKTEQIAKRAQAALDQRQNIAQIDDQTLPADLSRQVDGLVDHWQQLEHEISLAVSDPVSSGLDQARDERTGRPLTAQAFLLALDPGSIQHGLDALATKISDWHQTREIRIQLEKTLAADLDGRSWESFESSLLEEIDAKRQTIRTDFQDVGQSGQAEPVASYSQLMQRQNDIQEHIEQTEREIAAIESAILHTPRPPRLVADYDREIYELQKKLVKAREYYDSLALARSWVQKAYEELQATFGPRLNHDAAMILKNLTAARYESVKIDRSFAVSVAAPQDQQFHDWRYFSGGTIDQIYLALRLAVAGLIQTGPEPLPLLLDDTLVQYDDSRAAAAITYLTSRALESDGQILLLTSQDRIKKMAGLISPAISFLDL